MECPTLPTAGFADAMMRIKKTLHELVHKAGATLVGIGIACPGPLDPVAGIIGDVGTLPGWQGGNLAKGLSAEFGVTVAVENDADAAALAEARAGAGKGSRHLIYVTVSTGIGAGIILDGKLFRGAGGAHPEIGHMVIDAASGVPCYCRATGCWETLASGEAIATWMQTQNPVAMQMSAADICSLAEQGDELALRAMDREAHYLGIGLANLISIFTPETIVLGGGVMQSSHLILPKALQLVELICTQVPLTGTRIVMSQLGRDTGLAGAAQAWLARYEPT
jgi:glucokinase